MTMKYQVVYYKLKKDHKKAKQVATFYKIEDASMWEKHVTTQGFQNVEIVPVF
jgi:hypothetical protein